MAGHIDFLFIRLGAIGDVLRALPYVRAFKREFPEKRLAFLTQEASLSIIQGIPEIDLPLVFPRKVFSARGPLGVVMAWRWGREKRRWLREHGSPVVVDLHGTYKSALVARTIAPGRLIGFPRRETKEPVQFLYREKIALPELNPSRFARYEEMFRTLGLKGEGLSGLPLADKQLAAGRAVASTVASAVAPELPLAVLVVGTSQKEAYKRWPAARFGELAIKLKAAGFSPCIAWGPGEENLRDAAIAASGGAATALPSLPLLELFGTLAAAQLVVSADTGPLHAAALLGRPGVALFGATDATLNRPWEDSVKIITGNPLPWKPEYRGQPQWMEKIGVDEVLAACLDRRTPETVV